MNYTEQATEFVCAGEPLVGVLSLPERASETAVVVIVGGPQYRAGSHRQFVLLARKLASAGYAVLRFDYRGMGDSSGEQRDFEHVSTDVAAAIDLVAERVSGVTRIVLWGLCDGASAALLYCHETQDSRVTGLCLLNPWVRSEVGIARTHIKHYYTQRLMQGEFWAKLLRGGVAVAALGGLIKSLRAAVSSTDSDSEAWSRPAPFQRQMAEAWMQPHRDTLLLLSRDDFTAKEFIEYVGSDRAWEGSLKRNGLERHELPQADHTLSDFESRSQSEEIILRWLSRHRGATDRRVVG